MRTGDGLRAEGIPQAKEALRLLERLGRTVEQARSLQCLAQLLNRDEQRAAAEQAASRSLDLIRDKGQELLVCQYHDILWKKICSFHDEAEAAIKHHETALVIASSFGWRDQHFWILGLLGDPILSRTQGRRGLGLMLNVPRCMRRRRASFASCDVAPGDGFG